MTLITVKEASQMLGISAMRLSKILQENKMPYLGVACKTKKYWSYTIFRENIERYINENGKVV